MVGIDKKISSNMNNADSGSDCDNVHDVQLVVFAVKTTSDVFNFIKHVNLVLELNERALPYKKIRFLYETLTICNAQATGVLK